MLSSVRVTFSNVSVPYIDQCECAVYGAVWGGYVKVVCFPKGEGNELICCILKSVSVPYTKQCEWAKLNTWIRIRICISNTDPDPESVAPTNTDPIRIRIRNPAVCTYCT